MHFRWPIVNCLASSVVYVCFIEMSNSAAKSGSQITCGRKSQPKFSRWECTNILASRFGVKNSAHFLSVSNNSWYFSLRFLTWEKIKKWIRWKTEWRSNVIENWRDLTLWLLHRCTEDWRRNKDHARYKLERNVHSIWFLHHDICTHQMSRYNKCQPVRMEKDFFWFEIQVSRYFIQKLAWNA